MGVDPEQERVRTFHRVQAIEDATSLLASGIAMVAAPGWQARTGQPALQVLASGVEKLAKITLGMMDEADTGQFPDQKAMMALGHDIGALVRSLETRVELGATKSDKAYVLGLKRALDSNPYWPGLVEALATAADAKAGRYVHESALGGAPPAGISADEIWQDLDATAVAQLGLSAAIAGPEAREALVQVRTEILGAVVRWWQLVSRAWSTAWPAPPDASSPARSASSGARCRPALKISLSASERGMSVCWSLSASREPHLAPGETRSSVNSTCPGVTYLGWHSAGDPGCAEYAA